jgi:hypothetical protein
MSAHISDELPRLLTGEADRDTVLDAAAHLRTCVDCQHELVSAVVAHASLTSAQRFAPEIVRRAFTGNFDDAGDADPDLEHELAADAPPLPDLSNVFAEIRREAANGYRPQRQTSRRPYLIAAAAAAVVALGVGVGVYAATSSNSTNGKSSNTRTVALAAYDQGHTSGTATVGSGTVDLNATSLPSLGSKRYEVWLTNDRRTRMQPIGWVGDNGTAHLTVPADIMTQYNDLEVSVQNLDATDYTYSGNSVLRGSIG